MHLSDTKIKQFDKCPMNGYWLYERNVAHQGARIELEFGSAVHAGLKVLMDTKGGLIEASAAFREIFNMEDQKGIRTVARGEEILGAIFEQYMESGRMEDIAGEVKLVEKMGAGVEYEGRLDRLIKWDEEAVIMELKTSAAPGFFITKPNQQVTAYPFLASLHFKQRIDKVLVIIAGLSKYSKGGYRTLKNGDTTTIFREELVEVEDWEFELWQLDVVKKARAIERWKEENYWPKHTEACSNFGGCQFLPLCSANPKLHEMLIEANYGPYKVKEE